MEHQQYSYIDETLLTGEKVIYRTKPHWIVFGPAIVWAVALLFSLMVLPFTVIGRFQIGDTPALYEIFAIIAGLGLLINGVLGYLTYISSEYGITNKRVLIKVGFISRATLEVLLPKIESIQVYQTIMGRMFDYGTLVISGTGGTHDAYRNMPKPLLFRKITQQQAELAD